MSTVPTTGSRSTSPVGGSTTRPAPSRDGAWWRPERDQLVDAGALVALAVIAAYGLTTVYDGTVAVLLPAGAGAVAGVLSAWLVVARRLSPLSTLAVVVVGFVLGAGPALPDAAVAGFLPGPHLPRALVDALVHAWADLLTTAPPVDLSGGLGVIPYVAGFLTGAGGALLAWRTVNPLASVLPGLVATAGSFAFGTPEPASEVIQGGGFLAVSLAWAAHRSNRPVRSAEGIYWPRVWGAAVMLAILLPVGLVVGPMLPLVQDQRTVLREDVVPPFDPRDYPSPLAGLRAYRKDPANRERTYLVVEGLPKGERIRLATMDTYDGVVWKVSDEGAGGSGRFKRVGAKILPVPPWPAASIDVEVPEGGYQGVWVPAVGTLRSVDFTGADRDALTDTFRYNPVTGTAAATYEVAGETRYTMDVRVRPAPAEAALREASAATFTPSYPPEVGEAMAKLAQHAERLTAGANTPAERAAAIAQGLRDEFFFSDDLDGGSATANVDAGHSVRRLEALMDEGVGNAEQYAAAMALMAQQVGLPSRVVLGFAPEAGGRVVEAKGKDLTAWVEINFDGVGWVAYDPTPDEVPPDTPPPPPDTTPNTQQPLPPVTYVEPPPTIPPREEREQEEAEESTAQDAAGPWLPAWARTVLTYAGPPVLAIVAVLSAIVGLKALRRRRRRSRGGPVQQLHGAWLEMVDRLRDLGHEPDPRATRRELASEAAASGHWQGGPAFASTVDAHMFGPVEPDPAVASAAWSELDEHVRAVHAPLPRRRRVRAAVSTASLRPPRTRTRRADGPRTVAGGGMARRGRRRSTPVPDDQVDVSAGPGANGALPVADLVDLSSPDAEAPSFPQSRSTTVEPQSSALKLSIGPAQEPGTPAPPPPVEGQGGRLRTSIRPRPGDDEATTVQRRTPADRQVRAWRPVVDPGTDPRREPPATNRPGADSDGGAD